MAHKFRKTYLQFLEVGERHHRRRGVTADKHRKPIDEVANGGRRSSPSMIDPRREEGIRGFLTLTEKAGLFWLGFEVLPLQMGKDKVEYCDPPPDVFDFVFAAVADVFAVDLAVKPVGEQMIDGSAHWKAFGPGVVLGVKLVPEVGRALAPMGA